MKKLRRHKYPILVTVNAGRLGWKPTTRSYRLNVCFRQAKKMILQAPTKHNWLLTGRNNLAWTETPVEVDCELARWEIYAYLRTGTFIRQ